MHKSHLRSRVGCRNPALNAGSQVGSNFHPRWDQIFIPGGIKFSSQVGKVGSHHLRRGPTIPTWDPEWYPAYILPDILPGSSFNQDHQHKCWYFLLASPCPLFSFCVVFNLVSFDFSTGYLSFTSFLSSHGSVIWYWNNGMRTRLSAKALSSV